MIDLRLGNYRETLDGETWDALICDPPYSERTHSGYNDVTRATNRLADFAARNVARKPGRGTWDATYAAKKAARGGTHRRLLEYAHWTPDDVRTFVEWAAPRTRGWMVCMCDDVLSPVYREAMRVHGRLDFRVVWVNPSPAPRMCGDGPASSTVDIIVSRPRTARYAKWGSLPGHYFGIQDRGPNKAETGGKPLWLMRELIRDYSRPGDIVCDPCAGWGTTLVAARAEGRHGLGSEIRPEAFEVARARCADLPVGTEVQPTLWGVK